MTIFLTNRENKNPGVYFCRIETEKGIRVVKLAHQ